MGDILDWGIWMLLSILALALSWFYALINKNDIVHYKYFTIGLITKLIGGVAFASIYLYYYGGGDTFLYYEGAMKLTDIFYNSPGNFIDLFFSSHEGNSLSYLTSNIDYADTYQEWFMIRFISIFTILGFRSYLALTFLFSGISFIGSWRLYHFLVEEFPQLKKRLFYAVFLFPSVVFWGGGLLKDSVVLSCVCLMIVAVFRLVKAKSVGRFVMKLVLIGLTAFVLFRLKNYVLYSLIPGLSIGLFITYNKKIKHVIIKWIVGLVALCVIIGGMVLVVQNTLNSQESSFSQVALKNKIKGFHSWHGALGGSYYDLGVENYDATSVVSKIPAAINVTFFRPYPWESSNIVLFLAMVESLFVFAFFLLALWKWRIRLFTHIFQHPLLSFSFLFLLIFGFVVGFTSYNFGALVRYKIQCYPFLGLLMVYFTDKEIRENYKKSKSL